MWNYLYELWRSVLRRAPKEDAPSRSTQDDPRAAVRDELRRLLEERATLQKTAASYDEFGYEDLASRVRDGLASTDRKIQELRFRLRRRSPG